MSYLRKIDEIDTSRGLCVHVTSFGSSALCSGQVYNYKSDRHFAIRPEFFYVYVFIAITGLGILGTKTLTYFDKEKVNKNTMSAWLNTIGGTLYKDVMEVFFPKVQHSEARQSTIIKTIVLILGILVATLVNFVEKLGTILQVSNSLLGLVYGSFLSLFTLGIFFPRVNVKGAIAGTLASLLLTGWIVFNAQYHIMHGQLRFPGKHTSVDQCPASILENYHLNTSLLFNYTGPSSPVVADSSVPLIYQLSFNYYIVLGALSGILVGVLVSLVTEPPDLTTLNPDLFSTYVHGYLPRKVQTSRPSRNEYILSTQHEMTKKLESNGNL